MRKRSQLSKGYSLQRHSQCGKIPFFVPLFVLSDIWSPRNLFMIDFLKDKGPVSAAEFKVAFNSMDEATRKVCLYCNLSYLLLMYTLK
jgi:hypothetical protein